MGSSAFAVGWSCEFRILAGSGHLVNIYSLQSYKYRSLTIDPLWCTYLPTLQVKGSGGTAAPCSASAAGETVLCCWNWCVSEGWTVRAMSMF